MVRFGKKGYIDPHWDAEEAKRIILTVREQIAVLELNDLFLSVVVRRNYIRISVCRK